MTNRGRAGTGAPMGAKSKRSRRSGAKGKSGAQGKPKAASEPDATAGTKSTTGAGSRTRPKLTRDRILKAALAVADSEGIESLSMRRLGDRLGVQAMSLYNLVRDKDEIVDGIVDLVVAGIEVPPIREGAWRAAVRARLVSARKVLLRHPWAATLIESRVSSGPAKLAYLDSVIRVLFDAGFSTTKTQQALLVLDSHLYGFCLQELSWPFDESDAAATLNEPEFEKFFSESYPGIAALAEQMRDGKPDFDRWFEFGLDLILDGLERLRDQA